MQDNDQYIQQVILVKQLCQDRGKLTHRFIAGLPGSFGLTVGFMPTFFIPAGFLSFYSSSASYFIYYIGSVLGFCEKMLPLSQGWANKSSMVGRFLGSVYKHLAMMSMHSEVSFLATEPGILYFLPFIA